MADDEREKALELYSDYVEKLFWGKVVGVRVALAGAEAGVVKEVIRKAWEGKEAKGKVKR